MPEEPAPADEPDLGALLAQLFPRLAALEEPILRDAGLSMWEYTILSALASDDVVSQVELSQRTRRDPTRLGRHLDELASRGLLTRERASDQRQLAVRLTPAGRSLHGTVKRAVRSVEDELLHSVLSRADAARLRLVLARLAAGGAEDAPSG
ncbi:MarR family winged helix-turn-helix transcriptional regulator [Cellulomonas sp. NS3]|uniref:MarR family winged helix-turn-helix transcriptional regulator n=1 Tax=Cellulomonas sp. NS3 TaxID=2973977 RepID=UPI0021621BA1|nr:MarR family transcriptional regulator [Cellulomonas sp. NS3]